MGYGFWQVVVVIVYAAVVVFPAATILKKAGLSPWWGILAIVPVVNLIGFWIFAYMRWPSLNR